MGVLVKWTEPFSASDMRYLATPTAIGSNFCLSKLLPSIITFDGEAAGYDFPVPFFVIHCSDDNRTPPEAARLFVSHVRAPAKGYTAIDGAHFAFVTNPTGFLSALDADIRSLGISLGQQRAHDRCPRAIGRRRRSSPCRPKPPSSSH